MIIDAVDDTRTLGKGSIMEMSLFEMVHSGTENAQRDLRRGAK